MHSASENILVDAATHGNVAELVRLLAEYTDYNDAAMFAAIAHNHPECVRTLIGSVAVGTHAFGEAPLRQAVALEHLECIKELVEYSDVQGCIPDVLYVKNIECLVAVLPAYTPQCLGEMFEWLLVQHEVPHHSDKIEMLLPFADPRSFQGHVLKRVLEAGNTHLIDLLYTRCNPQRALAHLKREYPNDHQKWNVLESKIQARRIASEIDRKGVSVVRKM